MNVNNFENLKELNITQQIKQTLVYEMQEHFIDEPNELVNKLDEYKEIRNSFKKEAHPSCNTFEKIN